MSDLRGFLLNRGVDREVLDQMEAEKIDSSVIPFMEDSLLSVYLPLLGDRVAVRQFCKQHNSVRQPTSSSRKQLLLKRLKRKLERDRTSGDEDLSDGDSNSSDAFSVQKHVGHTGNKYARKGSRTISFGWRNMTTGGRLAQVRFANGGGSRNIRVANTATKLDIIAEAKTVFFPTGVSPLGNEADFQFDLLDAQFQTVDADATLQSIFEHVKPSGNLRLYMTTRLSSNTAEPSSSLSSASTSESSASSSTSHTPLHTDSTSGSLLLINHDQVRRQSATTSHIQESSASSSRSHPALHTDSTSGSLLFINHDQVHRQSATTSHIQSADSDTEDFQNAFSWAPAGTPTVLLRTMKRQDTQTREHTVGDAADDDEEDDGDDDDNDTDLQAALSASLTERTGCDSWQVELRKLQDSVDMVSSTPTGNMINVVRGSEFDCFKRAVSRKSFNPFRRLDIQFVDVDGAVEGAVDNGGPTREFFRLLLRNLFDGSLFEGPETAKQLCLSTLGIQKNYYYFAGAAISLSLLHGGPAAGCLSSTFLKILCEQHVEPCLSDVHDETVKLQLQRIEEADCTEEAATAVQDAADMLTLLGSLQPIRNLTDRDELLKRALHYYVVDRISPAITQFRDGLSLCKMYDLMHQNPDEWQQLFIRNEMHTLSSTRILELFKTQYSAPGSNRRNREVATVGCWRDWVIEVEDDSRPVSLKQLMIFATGGDCEPPLGFQQQPTIEFIHDEPRDRPSDKFLPLANTCGLVLRLPVHACYDSFAEAMDMAVQCSIGFGFA